MLVRINSEHLEPAAYDSLLKFLRKPFTEESCSRVEAQFPALGKVYRAVSALHSGWKHAGVVPLRDRPETAFQLVNPRPELLRAYVNLLTAHAILLEEDLRDHLERTRGATKAEPLPGVAEGTALALRCLSFHEATFLTLIGTFQACVNRASVEFDWTEDGAEALWDRVRTTTIQNFTDAATEQFLAQIGREALARRSSLADRPIWQLLLPTDLDRAAKRLLDTRFALSSHMQADPVLQPLIEDARQLCRWIALLAIVRQSRDHVVPLDSELLERLALNSDLPTTVLKGTAGELRSDQGFYRTARGELTLGNLSVGYSINCCKPFVLSDSTAQVLGKPFESHVRSYVADGVPATDYIVLGDVKAGGKHKGDAYDCDFILYEPRRRKVFFVQAKWKRDSRTANLDDEMKFWRQKNFALRHGVNQMKGLRDRLSEPEILNKAKTRLAGLGLTDEEIRHNSSFIVVHTLPFFGAHLDDGIAVYEWNLFRNALRRGEVERERIVGPGLTVVESIRHTEPLQLEDPRGVVDYFAMAFGADPAAQPSARAARTEAKYRFTVLDPTAGFWQRLVGKAELQVIRPFT